MQKSNLVGTQHFERNILNCIEAFKSQFCYITNLTFSYTYISKCCVPHMKFRKRIPDPNRNFFSHYCMISVFLKLRKVSVYFYSCRCDPAELRERSISSLIFRIFLIFLFFYFDYSTILEYLSFQIISTMLLTW